MATRNMNVGGTPTEFGGIPGLYGDNDEQAVRKATKGVGVPYDQAQPLEPHKARMALTQTDSTDPTSQPPYGDGGQRVA